MRRPFVALAALAGLWAGALPAPASGAQPSVLEAGLAEDGFARINDERAARGAPALRWDVDLARAAADWSRHMAATGEFGHRRLGDLWDEPWDLDYQALAENIAWGSAALTVARLHSELMASDGHRRNILEPGFDAVGLGVACDADGGLWLTQNFGRSRGSSRPALGSVDPPPEPQARTDPGPGCGGAAPANPLPARPPAGVAAPAHACPPERAPARSGFPDAAHSPHDASIACVTWWGLAAGTGAGGFDPAAEVSRAQMARFLTRLLDVAGVDLPVPTAQGYTDVLGSVHLDAIRQLTALGVAAGVSSREFAPSGPVRRDQMATFLVRSYTRTTSRALPAPSAPFTDHHGSVHRTNIDKAAALGLAAGTSDGTYSPEDPVRRDQMATFLVRVLDVLVREGFATPPGSR